MAVGGETLGERLQRAGRQRFVGRKEELEAFRSAVSSPGSPQGKPFSMMFIHGPGGIGKSALIEEMAAMAAAAGATPLRLDGRAISPTRHGMPEAVDPAAALRRPHRPVLLIDNYERPALDEWVRERLMPLLPAHAVVVLASRHPPDPEWSADPAWRELLVVVQLQNLSTEPVQAYLTLEAVPVHRHAALIRLSRGHPLALSLLTAAVARRRLGGSNAPPSFLDVPDVLQALVERMVEPAPSPAHRSALEICAHARFTTECLLRAVLGEGADVSALFAWLRGLSCIEEGPSGLFPDRLARDLLEADQRWRDVDGYAAMHRRVRTHVMQRIFRADDECETRRRIADAVYMARYHPRAESFREWHTGEETHLAPLSAADRPVVVRMTADEQGKKQAELVEHWLDRQPDAFQVFRDGAGRVLGFCALLALHEAVDADLEADPGARAMGEYAARHRPPRPDEHVLAWRFFVERTRREDLSDLLALAVMWRGERGLGAPRCAWEFVAPFGSAARWSPVLAYLDFARLEPADFGTGDHEFPVFAHDWRLTGPAEWLDLIAARELGAPTRGPDDHHVESSPTRAEFADAVRTALRDLRSPTRLATSVLLRAHVVRRHDATSAVAALRDVITAASDALLECQKGEILHRVFDRTFLRPAGTQEQAAALLNLPFNTYRRYRDRAVEQVTEWMWQRELGEH